MGAPLYEKLGFETETEYVFFKDGKIENNKNSPAEIIAYNEKFNARLFFIGSSEYGH